MLKSTIRVYRQKMKLTQRKLAEKTGLSVLTILRYESGEREPRASDIKRLCEVLGVSEDELLNGPKRNGLKFTIIWEVDEEMTSMAVKENEFKIGFGDQEDFGAFSFSKDADVEEVGEMFKRRLRAARKGRAVMDEELEGVAGRGE